ncbi:MAG: glycine zipper 2TM domain-containing protein [Rhodocyclales bacterium]|nr:glycine zipper 2TM domain-containing protein [Rhodocyclales bacterium]
METVPVARKTHPMILVAAASVTALSLTGVAALAGWLPVRGEAPAANAPVAATAPSTQAAPTISTAKSEAPATLQIPAGSTITVEPKRQAAAARAPARATTTASHEPAAEAAPRATRVANPQPVNDNGIYVENARPAPTQQQTQPPASCHDCGTVEAVREIAGKGDGTGLGAIAGGVLGGLLGSQVGGGNGKKAMAVVGAAGGAYAGHEVEKRMRGETQYEITVRFDDGRTRTYMETQAPQLQNGDRVRLANGRLVMI